MASAELLSRKKKSKSKSKQKETTTDPERERVKELLFQEDKASQSPSGSGRNSPAASGSNGRKTKAEERFEEVQKRRLAQKVAKLAHKTHKDRVSEFNTHLSYSASTTISPSMKITGNVTNITTLASSLHPPGYHPASRTCHNMAAAPAQEKKPHICPPSTATHHQTDGRLCSSTPLYASSPISGGKWKGSSLQWSQCSILDNAVPILTLLNVFAAHSAWKLRCCLLRLVHTSGHPRAFHPQSETANAALRFWDEALKINVDPFHILPVVSSPAIGISSPEIKATIDHAWGVVHNKHKKKDSAAANGDPDFKTQDGIQLIPIGQDMHRKRFWVIDGLCAFLFSVNLYLRVFAWGRQTIKSCHVAAYAVPSKLLLKSA
ncbi:DUF1754-domain-containing protein [Salix suchowensis]|nr:DUF1754-domain-containing protein [Salix suchowensis]